jgi:hypothetical protein
MRSGPASDQATYSVSNEEKDGAGIHGANIIKAGLIHETER